MGTIFAHAWCNYRAGTYPDSDRDEGEPIARRDEKKSGWDLGRIAAACWLIAGSSLDQVERRSNLMQPLISLRILKIDKVGTACEDGKAHTRPLCSARF